MELSITVEQFIDLSYIMFMSRSAGTDTADREAGRRRMQDGKAIHAVIGVRRAGGATFYVRRSEHMENYPGVWSLFSIQYDPAVLASVTDIEAVTPLFEAMSAQRLGGVPVRVKSYLTSGSSAQNPMHVKVTLHLYEIEFDEEPRLNARYYTDGIHAAPSDAPLGAGPDRIVRPPP
jgi:hypothetical protein